MDIIKHINFVIAVLLGLFSIYQLVLMLTPFLKKHTPHKKALKHRYAVLIAARNEEKVIGKLLQSINEQTYDRSLISVFVVADNCTDNTARVCRRYGAVVYERFNKDQVGKGYALQFLINKIDEDCSSDIFDAYMVFDADNILNENFVAEINKTFSDGYNIVTSYRNTKNFDDNWITASYGLWFMRESKFLNNSRVLIGSSAFVSGTGFLFSREIKKRNGGWPFLMLSEDTEFTADAILSNQRIGFCPTAMLYDEQPAKFAQSWTQRLRWSKGYLQVFMKYRKELFSGMFNGSLACFDMITITIPTMILTASTLGLNCIATAYALISNNGTAFAMSLHTWFNTFAGMYITTFVLGLITLISEWKLIQACTFKKVLSAFAFPIFIITYIPITICSLFVKAKWKPIIHNSAIDLKEIRSRGVPR